MGSGRHLETGSTRPAAPAKDQLRVYGMKFCPYVHRLKLVLAAKGIEHETVNINLKKKPEWYFDINPRGKVPTIEKNGDILYESDITSNYVDEVYGGKRLTTSDPLKRANELIVLGYFGDAVSGYYGLAFAEDDDKKAESKKKIEENVGRVIAYLAKSNKPFICGDEPGMTDYMVWPHLERMTVVAPELLKGQSVLQGYCERMEKDKAVQACRHSNALHMQFVQGYKSGNVVYDIGTVTEY